MTQEARGRRIFPSAPEFSLLLQKPTGQLPHGGGVRLTRGDYGYEVLLGWIRAGTPRTPKSAPVLERIEVEPAERIMTAGGEQPLKVFAHYSDQSRRDVTHLTMFQSNDSTSAAVSPTGLIKAGPLPGEAAIMARFMEKFAVCNVVIPLPTRVPAQFYTALPRYNVIDGLVWDKLQRLGITPSDPCSDSAFLRRAYLDALGRLPRPEEARAFLADRAPDRRQQLVDHVLAGPEWADLWANKWADLLRPNPYRVGIKAVLGLDAWLRPPFGRTSPTTSSSARSSPRRAVPFITVPSHSFAIAVNPRN